MSISFAMPYQRSAVGAAAFSRRTAAARSAEYASSSPGAAVKLMYGGSQLVR